MPDFLGVTGLRMNARRSQSAECDEGCEHDAPKGMNEVEPVGGHGQCPLCVAADARMGTVLQGGNAGGGRTRGAVGAPGAQGACAETVND